MPLASLADLNNAPKQWVSVFKNIPASTVNQALFQQTGSVQGVAAGGETTPPALTLGRVPTPIIPGYPPIEPFPAGARGYITQFRASAFPSTNYITKNLSILVCDRLYVNGPYIHVGSDLDSGTITSPSWDARVPFLGQSTERDYKSLLLRLDPINASVVQDDVVNVNYTDWQNQAALSTVVIPIGFRQFLPLPSPGVRSITRIRYATTFGGAQFNIEVLRPLFRFYVPAPSTETITMNFSENGLPEVFESSSLAFYASDGATGTSLMDLELEIAMVT